MKTIKDYITESKSTYFVCFNGSGLECHSLGETIRMAKKKSVEYHSATVICEEGQNFMGIMVPTRVWTDTYEEGKIVNHDETQTRYHSKRKEYVSVEEWEKDYKHALA